MVSHESVVEGLAVFSADGKKVGRVVNTGATLFEVEEGFLFPEVHLLSYEDVHRVDSHSVHLELTKDAVHARWKDEEQYNRLPPEPPSHHPR